MMDLELFVSVLLKFQNFRDIQKISGLNSHIPLLNLSSLNVPVVIGLLVAIFVLKREIMQFIIEQSSLAKGEVSPRLVAT